MEKPTLSVTFSYFSRRHGLCIFSLHLNIQLPINLSDDKNAHMNR